MAPIQRQNTIILKIKRMHINLLQKDNYNNKTNFYFDWNQFNKNQTSISIRCSCGPYFSDRNLRAFFFDYWTELPDCPTKLCFINSISSMTLYLFINSESQSKLYWTYELNERNKSCNGATWWMLLFLENRIASNQTTCSSKKCENNIKKMWEISLLRKY